ncbi:hypothetical protein B4926_15805 [Vibrio cholerae]|nr:hypothetical protein [Vibrio cholerae]EGR1114741.1 hypothetical protein [Vibrio cholerae]EGR5573212.1 hypothetical protein [Vibrio cholerae]MCD1236684.1 hypothetical protein [Vibrio cholerae]MCD1252932.1 hypothetical protein [Vibrio cholerae]
MNIVDNSAGRLKRSVRKVNIILHLDAEKNSGINVIHHPLFYFLLAYSQFIHLSDDEWLFSSIIKVGLK